MPELPEVEAIKRVIEPQIRGLAIERVTVNRPEVIAHPAADAFCRRLAGQVFAGARRRGKFLILCMESGDRLILHLRMTGCLLVTPADVPEEKHTHLVFHLSGGKELRFSDMRRFGRFWLLRQGEADPYTGMEKLGAEPFDPGLSGESLSMRLGKRKKTIKECLLDQSMIAGIGNIYSDEILFAARIHPKRPANTLTTEEWNRLASVIPERLAFFVEKNEITPEEYLETKGQEYRNTPFLQVYGHGGEPCPVCGGNALPHGDRRQEQRVLPGLSEDANRKGIWHGGSFGSVMANALSSGCPFPQCALYRADTERRTEFPDVLLRKPADLLQGGPAHGFQSRELGLHQGKTVFKILVGIKNDSQQILDKRNQIFSPFGANQAYSRHRFAFSLGLARRLAAFCICAECPILMEKASQRGTTQYAVI